MSKGLPRSLSRAIQSRAPVVRKMLLLNETINVADGAPGFGTVPIGVLPKANIVLLGVVGYIQLLTASGTVIAAWTGSFGVGSLPITADSLAGSGAADILPSAVLAAATAQLSPLTRSSKAGVTILDNTGGTLSINLNLLIDDASISGAAVFTLSGEVTLSYVDMADE